jgi:hypothetical protein
MSDTIKTPSGVIADTAILYLYDPRNPRRIAELAPGEVHRVSQTGALCSLANLPHVLQLSDNGKVGWKSVVSGTHVMPGQFVRVQFYNRSF